MLRGLIVVLALTVACFAGEPARESLKVAPVAIARLDPMAALGNLRILNAGCTATIIAPRRTDGRWDVLSAGHCCDGNYDRGTFTLRDGRVLAVTVTKRAGWPLDLLWLVTDSTTLDDLPCAALAKQDAAPGTKIWQEGYSPFRPQGRCKGTVLGGPDARGQMSMDILFGHGDSGGGIFDAASGELIAVVSSSSQEIVPGAPVKWYGPAASQARKLRPSGPVEVAVPVPSPAPSTTIRFADGTELIVHAGDTIVPVRFRDGSVGNVDVSNIARGLTKPLP